MNLEVTIGKMLRKKKATLAIAESCTGGLISSRITDVSGSSDYFLCGIAAYSNGTKENLLGVSGKTIRKYGAVSKQTALEMAEGARLLSGASLGIGVTGIAGPAGGTISKPAGLVYIAMATDKKQIVKKFKFKGSRKDIKSQASEAALELISNNI